MEECQIPRYPMRIGFQHRTIVSTAAAPVDHSFRQVATCISVRPVKHFDPPIMTSPFFFLTGRDSPQRNHRLRHSNPTQPNRTRYDWKWMAIFSGRELFFPFFFGHLFLISVSLFLSYSALCFSALLPFPLLCFFAFLFLCLSASWPFCFSAVCCFFASQT